VTSRFKLEKVSAAPPPFRTVTNCLMCGEPVTVEPDSVMATFTANAETIGICCDQCLTLETQVRLQRMRELARAAK
jgi:hypothetical protein